MGINWQSVGTTLSGITSALTAAGVTGTAQTPILQQIGALVNPGQSTELAICAQILQFAGNPAIVNELAIKLATTQGIPPVAASLAMTLTQPGVDIVSRVLQIEQLIKQGS